MALKDAAIVGFAETKIAIKGGRDVFSLSADILDSLLKSTGFEKDEIDGMITTPCLAAARNEFWSQTLSEYLGLQLNFCDRTELGGCSAVASVARAAAAIDAGLCSTVLLINADVSSVQTQYENYGFHEEWADPFGLMGPPGSFGLLSKRYEHEYGLDYTALAKLAVAQRNHALLNDNACEKLRKPITIDDYLDSRMISEPIRLLDCVMPADGANGLLVTSRKIAKAKGLDRFVVPVGYGEVTTLHGARSLCDVTDTGHGVAGERAFKQAGLKPADIRSFQPYDDFIIAIMLQLESLGFCGKGQGSAYIRDVNFNFDGDLPLNTGGGQISAGQVGLAGGGTNLVEAVRQLFGAGGARQVSNLDNTLVTGIGWLSYARNWGSSNVLVLTPDA
ncbi:thiolase family protein [Pseudomonas sp. CrR25]|nr:thiolase family protein [Pseudomonas sp. CrR25]